MAERTIKERAKRLFELKDVEVKTRGVEEMLAPLIKQVTTLQNNIPGLNRNKKLRNVFRLIQIVDKATDNFTSAAENIAADNPEFQEELWLAIEEVRTSGNFLHEAAHDYTMDVLASRKREGMEGRAADLLKAVTRLLVLIDLIDINELFKASSRIEAKLQNIKQVQTWETFVESMKAVAKDIRDVSETAIARQRELKNSTAKQLLVAAHAELTQQSKMLITSTKTFLQHPQDESAIENRDYTINRLSEVLKTVARLADGENPDAIQRDLDESDHEDIITPPIHSSVPGSPVHPPSSHLYPIEYHISAPTMPPLTLTPLHGTIVPGASSQTLSSDDEWSMDSSSVYHRSAHANPRVSGEFDHLQSDSKRESDHHSQDTYTSCSSFSTYRAEDEEESAVDISKRAQFLTGQSASKMYQVSSGTLPTELDSTEISSTHEHTWKGGQGGEQGVVSHADPTHGTASTGSRAHSKESVSLQVSSKGGGLTGQFYPRGHPHSSKVVLSTAVVGNKSQGSNVTVPLNVHTHQSRQRTGGGQKFATTSTTVSPSSSFASGQPLKGAGLNGPNKPPTLNMYPRGHAHLKSLQTSPTKTFVSGMGSAYANVASPPKSVEKNLENFESILEQTACTDPPPPETTEKLQTGFDAILNAASIIADSDSTRDQHGLLAQCDVVREKLQNLLLTIVTDKEGNSDETSQGTDSVVTDDTTTVEERGEGDGGEEGEEGGKRSGTRSIRKSVQKIEEETATLRAELRKAMIEHVSDTFVDPCVPLTRLVVASKQGNRPSVETCSEQFLIHGEKLVQVGNMVCSLTSDGPANREVRMATKPLESLKNQVVSAAKTLVGHPESESALKNMTAFQDLWIEKVNTLTDAVDKLIPLQDFIAVTEAHVREDSRRVVEAVEMGNFAMSIGCANVIQGRYDRLVQVVKQDMVDHTSRYAPEHAQALENVMERMTGKVLPGFQSLIHSISNKQASAKVYDSEIRNLEDHLQYINDGVRDMRIYILRTRTKEELKAEPDVDDILSRSSSGLSTPSSFEFMTEEMFMGNQPNSFPSPILNRASKHGEDYPKIEVDIEEVEVTGQQYASMLSYSSNMNILEGIKEEEEEESESGEEELSDREEKEREDRERQAEEEAERQRKKAEQEREEDVRKKNEEMLNKNFMQKRGSRLRKASSDIRLLEERPTMEDEDYVTATGTLRRRLIKRTPSVAVINETETAKAVMSQLSVQDQESIAQEQEKLEQEHKVFEKEVNKWDDTSNDIIVLAKEMCWMVMDMSDFLRGEGELLTTLDVINTVKDITVAARTFISLAQQVADLCPVGSNKSDLMAYLDRMKLFCNQLKITSGVLNDLGNLKETADNLNNLLISAKSLMNTVVLVVKGCYVASNAIKRRGGKLPVEMLQWKMMKPKKKLLYSRERLDKLEDTAKETPRVVEKSAIMELGAFRGRNSVVDMSEDTIQRVTMEEKTRRMKRNKTDVNQ